MSKQNGPQPYFRPKKHRWYFQIDGNQVNLGPDEAIARQLWHQIMGGVLPQTQTANQQPSSILVCRVIDLFVGWSRTHRPGRTAE
jgi:hypothetical protein